MLRREAFATSGCEAQAVAHNNFRVEVLRAVHIKGAVSVFDGVKAGALNCSMGVCRARRRFQHLAVAVAVAASSACRAGASLPSARHVWRTMQQPYMFVVSTLSAQLCTSRTPQSREPGRVHDRWQVGGLAQHRGDGCASAHATGRLFCYSAQLHDGALHIGYLQHALSCTCACVLECLWVKYVSVTDAVLRRACR